MGKKTSVLEGNVLVKWNKITPATFQVKESVDNIVKQRIENMMLKHGQYKTIVVATVNGLHLIVDGDKMYKSILKLQIDDVNVFGLGELNLFQYVVYRLLTNSNGQRIDYLSMADAISQICENEVDARSIANSTGIPLKDVKRYKDLIKFNWDAFLAKKIEPNQMDIFAMLGDR